MAESFGVEGRGSFYDEVGALRDVVQNHLLQMVCLLAMEPPVSADADALRDETAKVMKAIRPLDPEQLVRGQYAGYREEPGVAPDSDTETYVRPALAHRLAGAGRACPSPSGPARRMAETVHGGGRRVAGGRRACSSPTTITTPSRTCCASA